MYSVLFFHKKTLFWRVRIARCKGLRLSVRFDGQKATPTVVQIVVQNQLQSDSETTSPGAAVWKRNHQLQTNFTRWMPWSQLGEPLSEVQVSRNSRGMPADIKVKDFTFSSNSWNLQVAYQPQQGQTLLFTSTTVVMNCTSKYPKYTLWYFYTVPFWQKSIVMKLWNCDAVTLYHSLLNRMNGV